MPGNPGDDCPRPASASRSPAALQVLAAELLGRGGAERLTGLTLVVSLELCAMCRRHDRSRLAWVVHGRRIPKAGVGETTVL